MEKTRKRRWRAGERMPYNRYVCTQPRCTCSDIRLNDDGIWCEMHYIRAPRCSVCGDDRPSIPANITDGVRMCRDCWQDTFNASSITVISSYIGLGAATAYAVGSINITHAERAKKVELPAPVDFPGECHVNADGVTVHVFGVGGRRCQCQAHKPRRRASVAGKHAAE